VHAYARARQKEQRPRHSITLTLHPLTQIQKTPRIYAEIFGPNLAAKLLYRLPLGVMHCIRVALQVALSLGPSFTLQTLSHFQFECRQLK
jgi:hypothetical protein